MSFEDILQVERSSDYEKESEFTETEPESEDD